MIPTAWYAHPWAILTSNQQNMAEAVSCHLQDEVIRLWFPSWVLSLCELACEEARVYA